MFLNMNCVSLQLSVPASLNLLPGQIHMLREAVEQEKERIKTTPPTAANTSFSPYISLQADMPAWVLTKLNNHVTLTADGHHSATTLNPQTPQIQNKSGLVHLMICAMVVCPGTLQLLPQCVPSGGGAAAWEGGHEGKHAAAAGEQWKHLCRYHQTGLRWVGMH